jgi:hypothetical protein
MNCRSQKKRTIRAATAYGFNALQTFKQLAVKDSIYGGEVTESPDFPARNDCRIEII